MGSITHKSILEFSVDAAAQADFEKAVTDLKTTKETNPFVIAEKFVIARKALLKVVKQSAGNVDNSRELFRRALEIDRIPALDRAYPDQRLLDSKTLEQMITIYETKGNYDDELTRRRLKKHKENVERMEAIMIARLNES